VSQGELLFFQTSFPPSPEQTEKQRAPFYFSFCAFFLIQVSLSRDEGSFGGGWTVFSSSSPPPFTGPFFEFLLVFAFDFKDRAPFASSALASSGLDSAVLTPRVCLLLGPYLPGLSAEGPLSCLCRS